MKQALQEKETAIIKLQENLKIVLQLVEKMCRIQKLQEEKKEQENQNSYFKRTETRKPISIKK